MDHGHENQTCGKQGRYAEQPKKEIEVMEEKAYRRSFVDNEINEKCIEAANDEECQVGSRQDNNDPQKPFD